MLGGGAGACDCLLEALDSGRDEDERCAFVEAAGACVDGGAILYSRAMLDLGENEAWRSSFTDSLKELGPLSG